MEVLGVPREGSHAALGLFSIPVFLMTPLLQLWGRPGGGLPPSAVPGLRVRDEGVQGETASPRPGCGKLHFHRGAVGPSQTPQTQSSQVLPIVRNCKEGTSRQGIVRHLTSQQWKDTGVLPRRAGHSNCPLRAPHLCPTNLQCANLLRRGPAALATAADPLWWVKGQCGRGSPCVPRWPSPISSGKQRAQASASAEQDRPGAGRRAAQPVE